MIFDNFGISSVPLTAGDEFAGLGILEITTIPHQYILDETGNLEETLKRSQGAFAQLLSELHRQFVRTRSLNPDQGLSSELLWLSQTVDNQPFKARIRLFLIIRSICHTEATAITAVADALDSSISTLSELKYEMKQLSYGEFAPILAGIASERVQALCRSTRIVNLQSPIMPQCFAYDLFPRVYPEMSAIANSLNNNPDCCISFQFITSEFSDREAAFVDGAAKAMSNLARGLQSPGVGNISNPLAEKPASVYTYYSQARQSPLFSFNIVVYGNQQAVAGITGRVQGMISGGSPSGTAMTTVELKPNELDKDHNFYPLPWALDELLANKESQIPGMAQYPAAARLPRLITSEEAALIFRLPIGSDEVAAGFAVNNSGRKSKTFSGNIINGADINVGNLRSSTQDKIGFFLNDLTRHMLIVGTPGSGKTTYSISMLEQLWKTQGIPFLAIEPAKAEYRSLLGRIPELQIFTPGKSDVSPFLFNPFIPPKNVKLEAYKATLKTAFAAAATMTSPLDRILEESISNCYSDFYWLNHYTSADRGQVFSISDFIACFQKTFDEIGYTGDVKNIGQAGVVRLKGLASLFDNYGTIPIEDLLSKPTIIELSAIENSDQKTLLIALLLLSVLAYVNSNYQGDEKLKNVILLEEAHVLLAAESNRFPGEADPSGIAQALIKRMLAEIRAFGVGLVIADQSPRKVTADVIAMTDIKLAFRLVETEDRRIIADSINMSEQQATRLARLKLGEAFLFFRRLEEPEEIITEDYRGKNGIPITISDEEVRQSSTYWSKKKKDLRPYPECARVHYCALECDLNIRSLAKEVARRIFTAHIQPTKDAKAVSSVFADLDKHINSQLNGEPFSKKLRACVRVHLWRLIRFQTKLTIAQQVIDHSIDRE